MLAFVHIPKTAGTTLHKVLSHQYPRILIHHDSDGAPDAALASRIREINPQIVMGHFSVGIHEWIPEVRYITCIREPVARILSHYQHACNDPAHYLHNAVISSRMDPADYVSSGLSGELSDGMTRMIAGAENFHQTNVDSKMLALAKSNIERFFEGVVLTEDFDTGLLLLADSLDWKTPYYFRRKVGHYGSAARKADERVHRVIEEHNRFDCELYDWVKSRFEGSQSGIPGLIDRNIRFKRANRLKGKVIYCFRELRRRLGQS